MCSCQRCGSCGKYLVFTLMLNLGPMLLAVSGVFMQSNVDMLE